MSICPSCGSSDLQEATGPWREATDNSMDVDVFLDAQRALGVRADFVLDTAIRCRRCGNVHATYREVR